MGLVTATRQGPRFEKALIALVVLAACSVKTPVASMSESSPQNAGGPYVAEGLERSGIGERVKEAMSRVPRHEFVSTEMSRLAYADRALPIAHKQTISQPYIVAVMTQAAEIEKGAKVLEIGTGSGYQAAVLAEMGAKVFTIEIIPELAEEASARLKSLGYQTIDVRTGDGWNGWEEKGPFDAIIVTAASPSVPPKLLSQLAERGRMILPLEKKDEEDEGETLMSVQKKGDSFITRKLGAVKFVPLTGEARVPAYGIAGETRPEPKILELFFQDEKAVPLSSSKLRPSSDSSE